MFALTLGPAALRGRNARPSQRREDIGAIPADPAAVLPGVVSAVEAVEAVPPQMRRYRATVKRSCSQSATVEFDALETADTYVLAQELLPQIPADAWVLDPVTPDPYTGVPYGYIDRIDEVVAEAAPAAPETMDPLAAPAALSRRGVKVFRKGSYQVGDYGTFEAETPEAAIAAMVTASGFDSAAAMAESLGLTEEQFLALALEGTVLVDTPTETLSRRLRAKRRLGRKSNGWEIFERLILFRADIDSLVQSALPEDAEQVLAKLNDYRLFLNEMAALTPDDAAEQPQMALDVSETWMEISSYLDEQIALAQEAVAAMTAAPVETLSRRFRRKMAADVLAAVESIGAEADAILAAPGDDAVELLDALMVRLDELMVSGLADETDAAASEAASVAVSELQVWLEEQIAALEGEAEDVFAEDTAIAA